jgi:hypothetical protein
MRDKVYSSRASHDTFEAVRLDCEWNLRIRYGPAFHKHYIARRMRSAILRQSPGRIDSAQEDVKNTSHGIVGRTVIAAARFCHFVKSEENK